MTQPAPPGSADWQRRWAIDAGSVMLQPVTRRIAQDVLDGGPITRTFEARGRALMGALAVVLIVASLRSRPR
jgi:hypothetical protein